MTKKKKKTWKEKGKSNMEGIASSWCVKCFIKCVIDGRKRQYIHGDYWPSKWGESEVNKMAGLEELKKVGVVGN